MLVDLERGERADRNASSLRVGDGARGGLFSALVSTELGAVDEKEEVEELAAVAVLEGDTLGGLAVRGGAGGGLPERLDASSVRCRIIDRRCSLLSVSCLSFSTA